jgi:hypothetical protein
MNGVPGLWCLVEEETTKANAESTALRRAFVDSPVSLKHQNREEEET